MTLLVALLLQNEGELLYNGLRLSKTGPVLAEVAPPEVVPIDVGRQLFVDDFLIAETTLKRVFHAARYHPRSPVLRPDKPWEEAKEGGGVAMAFSDGVWWDPKD